MESLLISACLLGASCKYSGGNNQMPPELISRLRERYDLVPVCPEVSGGLPTPRRPSERRGDRVVSDSGQDVTDAFQRGAETAIALARRFGCAAALLKENSPSCGSASVYDGSFTGRLIPGAGVTAEALEALGLRVIGESRVWELLAVEEDRLRGDPGHSVSEVASMMRSAIREARSVSG